MRSFTVKIPEDGKAFKVAYDSDAALRKEALDVMNTQNPEFAPLFGKFMLVFQHRDALECIRSGDNVVHAVENPMASELGGYCTVSDDRVYGPAYIVANDSMPPALKGIPEEDADRFCRILSSTQVPKRMNDVWDGKLAYVDELAPGQGFAYFLYGSDNVNSFVGWRREPREMYAEPPFDTGRISVDVVGYKKDGLLLDDRETSVMRMASESRNWMKIGPVRMFGRWTTPDEFIYTLVHKYAGQAFVEKER